MKKVMEKMNLACKVLFEGELHLSKKDFWLAMVSGILMGVVIGLFCAPMTHGVYMEIGSNNGNHSGNCGSCEPTDDEEKSKTEK